MPRRTMLLVLVLLGAGCAAPEPEEGTPPPTAPAAPGASSPDLPAGQGALAWTQAWDNTTGPALFPPEPYGPFTSDVTLTLEAAGDAARIAVNVTTETETILRVLPVEGDLWRITVLHHHHGLTQEEADARATSLHNDHAFLENGTRLDMFVDTADAAVASAGAQTEIYVTIDVPGAAQLALHLVTYAQPLQGLALDAQAHGVCLAKLSLEAAAHPVALEYTPTCQGALRLANGGGSIDAFLVDGEASAFRGTALSQGGEVVVDLERVEYSHDSAERKEFDTPGWQDATAPLDVHADAAGGTLRLLGCAHWDCAGGG